MTKKLKINGNVDALNDELLKRYVDENSKRSPFKQFLRYCVVGLHLLVPVIGWARLFSKTVTIYEGELGISQNSYTGEYILLPPGRHVLLSPFHNFSERVQINNQVVNLGPFKIVTVNTGEIAITNKNGAQNILQEGRHMLDDPTHIYKSHVSTKQQIKKIEKITVNTADNIPVRVEADVFYQITDPDLALRSLEDIDRAVLERAENSLASVFMHHSLMEISPISFNVDSKLDSNAVLHMDGASTKKSKEAPPGINNIVKEFMNSLFTNLQKLGILLHNVGINSLAITDKDLQHEMGQQAVTWVKTAAALQTAENNKKVTITNAEAEAASIKIKSQAEADASATRAKGYVTAGKILEENKFGQQIQFWASQKDIVGSARTTLLPVSSNLTQQFVLSAENENSAAYSHA